MSSLKIAVCGCGNGAHTCAALMSRKGHSVSIYSPIEEETRIFQKNYEENGGLDALIVQEQVRKLPIAMVSSDPGEVITEASIIFVIVPAFAHKTIFQHIKKYMSRDALIAILPSRGLIELEIKEYLPDAKVMAFQTLPWSCRKIKTGSSVNVKGIKERIQVASRPSDLSPVFYHVMEDLLDMKIERVRSIMTLTLANMGQIFHPGILYGIFKDDPGKTFTEEECPLFYQGVTEETAELLTAISLEIKEIGEQLSLDIPELQLEKVLTPSEWLMASYKDVIEDSSSLKTMLNTNQAYKGIKVPAVQLEDNRYQADFHCRYVTEDVPYSLLVTRTLGNMAGVRTPVMDQVIRSLGQWINYPYLEKYHDAEEFSSQSRLPIFYGMDKISDLLST